MVTSTEATLRMADLVAMVPKSTQEVFWLQMATNMRKQPMKACGSQAGEKGKVQ